MEEISMQEQDLHWVNLPFDFNGCNGYVRCDWRPRNFEDFRVWKPDPNWTIEQGLPEGNWSSLNWVLGDFIKLPIAAGVFHYGIELFEGLKLWQWSDRSQRTFRPEDNAQRFFRGAQMMVMPPFPETLFMEAVKMVVENSRNQIPPAVACQQGASFYIRPFEFASGQLLGVKPSFSYTVIVYGTPVGSYFRGGFRNIGLFLTEMDRVPRCGTGQAKAGANYAPSIPAYLEALSKGCHAPLYRDPVEKEWLTETHASNFACVIDGVYLTPPNSSLILPSITNDSLITLCNEDLDIQAERKNLHWQDIRQMQEAAGIGTGAIISPVGWIDNSQGRLSDKINPNQPGPIMTKLYKHLLGIQTGQIPDTRGWMVELG